MASRQHYYAESLGESTTTSTTYGDKVALTFTPDANSDYLFIWTAKATNTSNITSDYKVRLFDDTGSTTLAELNIEGKDVSSTAGDYQSVGGIAQMSFGASPSSQTVSIEFAAETATNTIRISNATITAIKKHASDQFASADSSTTTSSTTFQDKATLTFTPATQGDYLILSSCEWNDDGGGNGGEYRLLDPTSTAIALQSRFPQDAATFYPWNTIIQQNLTASSKTYKTQWRALGTGTSVMTHRKSRIYALRLDTLPNYFYGEARSRTTTTSTTYQDKVTLTDTPAAFNQLRIAVGMSDGNVTNNSSFINFDQGGSSLYEVLYEPSISGGVDGTVSATMTASRYTGSGSSTTWKTQFRSEATALTTGFASSAIAVLQLSESEGVTGTIAVTLDNATSSITGHSTSGTIAVTLANATSSIAATQTQSGTLATTLGDATSSIAASHTQSGTIAVTLADATSSIAALQTQEGTIAVTLADATSAITGHTTSGTIAVTLDNATADFSGTVVQQFSGALATTLDNATSAIAALQTQTGTVAVTLANATSNISAAQTQSGTLATTLGDATMAASGAQTYVGTLSTTLAGATAAITALQTHPGTLATTLDNATMSASGQVPYVGTIAVTLDNFTMQASGNNGVGGGLAESYIPGMRRRRR